MCEIGLEIGPHARALIIANVGSGTAKDACQIADQAADQAAQIIEPKLSRG